MLAWYAEEEPPEKYMPTVGWYSASQASNQASACSCEAGRRRASRHSSTASPAQASRTESPMPAAANSGSSLAAVVSRPAVAGRPNSSSRGPGPPISSAGGAGVIRRAEASMLRVSRGMVRLARTRIAVAWPAKWSA